MTSRFLSVVCFVVFLVALGSPLMAAIGAAGAGGGVVLDNSPELGPTVNLTVDDGTSENSIGDVGQFIWINRFTPAPADFPFALTEVQAVFGTTSVTLGGAAEVVIHEDTDADGDPGTGAVLRGVVAGTVQANDGATFSTYPVTPPVVFCGPGDVLIGVINRYGSEGFNDFPASLDTTATQGRSWAASYLAGDVPANPSYPADEQWGTIDSFGFPGNWIVRGTGSRSAVEVDLALAKSAQVVGDQIDFTLTVTDTGSTCGATGVVVSDPLPAGVTYVSDDCGGSNTPPWTWNVGALASGASASCIITVSIDPGAVFPLVNTASVVSDQTDTNASNDSATITVNGGGGPSPLEIPTLGTAGLVALLAGLAFAAVALVRRSA